MCKLRGSAFITHRGVNIRKAQSRYGVGAASALRAYRPCRARVVRCKRVQTPLARCVPHTSSIYPSLRARTQAIPTVIVAPATRTNAPRARPFTLVRANRTT